MLKKAKSLFDYYGIRGMAAKIWEKYVIDRKRFRAEGKTEVPYFPSCPNKELFLSISPRGNGTLCIQYGTDPAGKRASGKGFYSGYGGL